MFQLAASNFIPADSQRYITARSLRDLGFLLCENIPDEAVVRRMAVGLDVDEDLADNNYRRLRLRVFSPFASRRRRPSLIAN